MEISKDYFNFFVEEINKYAEGVNFLNPGIEEGYIEKAEEKLKVKLPEEYKAFLRIYNGGEIFRPGTVLSEIYKNPDDRVRGGAYLNDAFDERFKTFGVPANLLIIGSMSFGDAICIDLEESTEIAKIKIWSFELSEIDRSWESLKDWLSGCLEIGEMLMDYNGIEKELDF